MEYLRSRRIVFISVFFLGLVLLVAGFSIVLSHLSYLMNPIMITYIKPQMYVEMAIAALMVGSGLKIIFKLKETN